MVAIFSGSGTGSERSSGSVLGSRGLLGAASLGRNGEQVFVNAANGNLLISQKDEFLVGRGPDAAITRTYNSLGDMSDDNADNWRQGTDFRISGLTGTVNTFGSTVRRVSADGSDSVYSWDGSRYVTGDGHGAHDSLTYSGGTWTWTDGSSQIKETYAAYGAIWRIAQRSDTDGNSLTFTYSGANLAKVSTADGGSITYEWSGNRITRVVTASQDASLARTYYSYDGLGRLSSVNVDLSPTDYSIGNGATYTTTYTYVGSSKLVASISQTDGSRLDLTYDWANRVSTFTETIVAGSTRTTTLGYGAGYTEITDSTGQKTRLDYAAGNFATEVETWGSSNVTKEAATIDGAAATKFTVQTTAWSAISQGVAVAAGETVTFGVTMQASGTVTSQSLGLYSDVDGWGAAGISSARIVSGPGQLVQTVGGLWTVTGLSTTQGTRIEVTRTYAAAQNAGAYLYFDHPGGYRAGTALTLADISLVKSATAANVNLMNLANWTSSGVSRTAVGTIDGTAAYKYTVQAAGGWSAVYSGFAAAKGDSYSLSLSLQASDGYTSQSFGLYGDGSGWGSASGSTARIVSGPGTLSQQGALWTVSGLSATQVTRVEIVRTYQQDENAGAYIYADLPGNFRAGASLTIAAAHLVKRMSEPASAQLLTKITAPPAQAGGAPQVVQFGYNGKGDLVSVTDAAGNATTYTYDSSGNVLTETDRLGAVVTRTYGANNQLLTETRSGSNSAAADAAHTTRFVYDGENHLRFVVTPEGAVTEYRYDSYGFEIAKLEYPESTYNLSGLASGASIAESTLVAWVSALPDRSSVQRTNTYYDVRGNVSSVVTSSSATKYGEGADSAQILAPGANTTVSTDVNGYFRITKTSGSAAAWDADAHSLVKAEGDFVVRLRPAQSNMGVIAGLSTAPGVSASYTDPEYGLYFTDAGTVYYMESGSYVYLNTNYVAGDVFWINRTGTTINYYKGATLGAAEAAGPLRTRTGATQTLYFDSSFHSVGAAIDVNFHPFDINTGTGATVFPQSDGSYRIVKSGSADSWDSDARSTIKADGDFVLRLKPAQSNKHMVGGVALSPGANASYTNPNYGFYFVGDGSVHFMESGSYSSLGVTHSAGENFWLVRSGSTISYYKGSTLEAAMAAGALRTRTGATGTMWFDSSLHNVGSVMEADFRPATAIANGINTAVTTTADGLYRITKTGGAEGNWDADARSSTRTDGDFVLRLRPAQADKHVIGGVATAPSANAYYTNPDYGLFFVPGGGVYYMEAGNYQQLAGVTYAAGDNFWVTRVGSTISYYKGATLEAAVAAGALRTRTGVSGSFHFDSSFHSVGAVMDVAFTPTEANGSSAVLSRSSFVYDQAGQLLSRQTDGQNRESFVYDGLGRTVASTDLNGGTTSIVFNDAATQTVVTLASGLVTTSTYNKVGNLVSSTESGSYVAGGTTTSKYDRMGRLRMTTDAAGFNKYFVYDKVGRLVAEVLHNGFITEYRYDSNDRVVATLRYMNAVSAANLATLADPNSTIEMAALRPAYHSWDICTWQIYDKEGRVTATMDSGGSVRTFEYDKSGRLVKTTAYANRLDYTVYTGFKTTTPTAVILPAADSARDSVARNFYDKDGQQIASLNGEGFLSRTIYDRAGQKVEEIAYLNPTNASHRASGTLDQLVSTQPTNANDRRTRFVYDGQGQLRYRIDALNQVTEFGYNAAGQLTQTTRYAAAMAATTDYTYDNVKGLIAASALPASSANRRTWSVYDASGRVGYSIDAEGAVTRFTYDNRGQVTKTVQFAVKRSTTAAPSLPTMDSWAAGQNSNAGNRVTRNYYSARGELRFSVDPEGFVSRTDFDAAGRVTREVRWDSAISVTDSSTIDNVNALATSTWADTRYGYDFGGALTDVWNGENNWTHYTYYGTQKIASVSLVETDQSWTYYSYDGAGRVVEEIEANATAESTRIAYAYDGHGNVVTIQDAKNEVTTRTYDRLGRMLTETDRLGAVTSYEYNAFAEAVKVTDARLNSTYNHYDRVGRLTASRDSENYVTQTTYNVFGEATTVTRRYNRASNAASVSVVPTVVAHNQDASTTFAYDRLGRLVKVTDAQGHYEQYTLNAFGNRISVRNKIGGVVTNAFNRRGQLVSETLPMASIDINGNTVASSVINKFEYDARGNSTKKIEAFGLAEQRTTTYVYDKANRLIETRGDAVTVTSQANHIDTSSVIPTEKFKYDQRGRLIEKTDALGARTLYYYDKKNRKVAEIGALGTYSAYTYDKNGNVLTERVYGTAVAVPATAGGSAPAAPGGEYREKTYSYDKLNRLKTASIANVRTGAWNGSFYATAVGTVTTTNDYDSNGNLIRTTDGAGGIVHSFYDKANRKIAQVDAENYLTFYTLDGEGNVTQEERFATKLPGTVTTASDPAALRSSVAGNAADRITQFSYDKNGRRISETRLNVATWTVGATGALAAGTAGSVIQYAYNGLGEVTQKTFGNGDYISYVYDSTGRLIQESRAPFTDLNGASVRPTTFYHYNGLNDVTLSRQGGFTRAAGDRMTRYTYGAGGRRATMTDASGAVFEYRYDAAGNVVRESWVRQRADGSSVTDGMLYNRDLLGRVTSQALANAPGNYWVRGDSNDSAYNAYGEIHQRGVNGMWQEQFGFDGAGRLYRTNSGDGVWRYFGYDGAGRQTLVIESEGTSLANLTIDQALAVATANGAYHVGGAYIDGITATINVFDKRGLAVQTRAPKRQLSDTAAAQDFTINRTHNAFGETASETDARGFTTDYSYNQMGRLTKKQSPTVNYTGENGAVASARPTEDYYFDRAGRLVATRDANGNLISRALLAGTGHDGSQALVAYEYHSDGGYLRNDYDVFGDKRVSWDEINRRTDMTYDSMGRLTQVTHPIGLIDYFGYDQLGQKISHWNNVYQTPIYGPPEQVWVEDPPYYDPYYGWIYPGTGHYETHTPIVGYAPEKEVTDYDFQGRVTRQVAFGGDYTTTSYSWNGGIATAGMGTFGGWTETTTMVNGRSSTEQTDLFGRQVYKSDLGGHVYTFSYDLAGRMTQRTSGETINYTWLNTGKVAQSFSATGDYGSLNWTRKGTTYGYDASGNLVSERLVDEGRSYYEYWDPYYGYQYSDYSWSNVSKNATATYDGLNRIVTWGEAGSGMLPPASTSYEYDLAGNIRRSYALYRSLDNKGVASAYNSVQDNWYRYDSMNRLVTKGSLWGGQIVRGYGGSDYLYDKAGQRVSASRTAQGEAWVYQPYYDYDPFDPYYTPGGQYVLVYYDQESREDYTYDNGGVLTSVRIAQGGYTENGDGSVTPTPAPAYAALRASYTNDLMGRVTRQIDWQGDGTSAAYDRTITYNGKGQVTNETVVNKQGSDTITSYTNNEYGYGYNYALGAVTSSSSSTYKNGAYQSASSTTNSYAWYDGAVQAQISHKPNSSQSTTFTTTFNYDGSGSLSSIYVADGRPRTVTFVNDANGQAIRRDESDNSYANGDPHDIWYRFGGKQMGAVGNNGTLDTDYATSITNRTRTSGTGAFRFGTSYGASHADFDLSNETISSYSQGVASGSYTARSGDSLETIAANLWGDSSLWYKLAEANGMASANGLVEGQRLIIPAGVLKNHHNASTFKPFDPGETLGDINPTTPKPQKAKKGGKCGVFGAILLVVIAVAVTAITAGAAAAALAPGIASIGAGMGALAAGTTGLSAGALIGIGAASAAMGSIASQAFGVATGIQEKFDWKGVALAAIGGAVGAGIGAGGLFGSQGAFGGVSNAFAQGALRGVLSSAASQGIGMAVGLQKKFDWVGIAAAGVGGGASSYAGSKLGSGVNKYVGQFVSGGAGAVADAATRSLLDGTDFGDNLLAALPGVVGSTIGNMVADAVERVTTPGAPEPAPALAPEPADPEQSLLMMDVDATMFPQLASLGEMQLTPNEMQAKIRGLLPFMTPDEFDAANARYAQERGRIGQDAAMRNALTSWETALTARNIDHALVAQTNIDWTFIREREGFLTRGYVPRDDQGRPHANSGVTIGTGFDLGRRDPAELRRMGVPQAMVDRLTPYLGLKGADAQAALTRAAQRRDPLVLTAREASTLDALMRGRKAQSVAQTYNARSNVDFQDLAQGYQTVIASVHFQYGSITATPGFMRQVTTQDWSGAIRNLRNFGDSWGPRRRIEANLMERTLTAERRRTAPQPQRTPPQPPRRPAGRG